MTQAAILAAEVDDRHDRAAAVGILVGGGHADEHGRLTGDGGGHAADARS